ncbi:chromosomal replication initiator protein DnaA [Humisphaera borealis]|uniref:Chromosomal replication initiator protein DnaA n=1 Tax=Humisphaera borealis TaxID=2807512 RepID=A0A7M2WX67_9BACT|nr:chromosomal replication initiator protein DnaA [Humisphaera borealis]QOV90085.1 chromosomal replication initiator protein DnaA [Humisphaera borealis]
MTTTHMPTREVIRRAPDRAHDHSGPHPLDPAVWQRILNNVRIHHPTLNRVWFDQMSPRQLTNGVIQATVQTPAQLNFCQSQCQQPFTAAAQAITGRLVSVSFHCDNLPRTGGGIFNDHDQPLQLNPDLTFENFVIGPCNRLAHAASTAVGEQPGKAYNPLFIHGGVGLGKTHLLQAISQRVLERDAGLRILYLSCDSFINQFMNAVENGEMNQFRHRYRDVDILIIDDIHFLAGRDRTQEEFFHTFNTLYQGHKQIILSADCPPSEIPELEERLVSRFNWGLVAPIDKPCYETRVAIVKKKSKMRGLELPDDVVCYVAAKIDNNTRELEGAITKLQGMSMLHEGRIDMEVAKAALGETVNAEQKRVTIQHILDAVTKYYNVRLSDLQSKRRHKSIAFPRQVCMYLARRHTRFSLEEIGGYFGGRDHTTVMHAVRTVTADVAEDPEVAQQLNRLEAQLTN